MYLGWLADLLTRGKFRGIQGHNQGRLLMYNRKYHNLLHMELAPLP